MYAIVDQFSQAIFGGSNVDLKSGYQLMNNIAVAFCTWKPTGEDLGTYDLVQDIYMTLAPLAMTLALCYMVIGVLQLATRTGWDNLTLSLLLVPLLKYAACLALIKYGLQLSGYLMGGSNYLVRLFLANKPGLEANFLGMDSSGLRTFNSMLPRILFEAFIGLVGLLTQIFCGILLAYQIITIRIEYLIRVAFMPLAIANIAQDGAQGAGVRYLKKIVGNMFMLVGILLSVRLTFYVLNTVSVNMKIMNIDWIDRIVQGLLVAGIGPFCAVGAVTSFKAALNEMFA